MESENLGFGLNAKAQRRKDAEGRRNFKDQHPSTREAPRLKHFAKTGNSKGKIPLTLSQWLPKPATSQLPQGDVRCAKRGPPMGARVRNLASPGRAEKDGTTLAQRETARTECPPYPGGAGKMMRLSTRLSKKGGSQCGLEMNIRGWKGGFARLNPHKFFLEKTACKDSVHNRWGHGCAPGRQYKRFFRVQVRAEGGLCDTNEAGR